MNKKPDIGGNGGRPRPPKLEKAEGLGEAVNDTRTIPVLMAR